MSKQSFRKFSPDWVVPPGATIADLLEERGWSQTEFAIRTEYTRKHVNLLIQGKVSITEDTAIRLERVLGSTVSFWLNREVLYREALARKEELNQLDHCVGWLKQLPIKDMIKFEWIRNWSDKRELVAECLKFFGVASVSAWEAKYNSPIAAFRASKLNDNHKGATSVWLRKGELEISEISCAPFEKNSFISILQEVRSLTQEEKKEVFIPKLIQMCSNVGVALAVVPAPKGCPISGATRWLGSDKALIVLSDRYKTNDQFWFSFFHEAGHLLLHSKKLLFIDLEGQLDDKHENEANAFASQALIPLCYIKQLKELPKSEVAIKKFSKSIGIAPGIVVGRMQRERLLPWNFLNKLKVKV